MKEITLILTNKIDNNATNINQLLEENRIFKRENVSLREWLTKLR